MGKTFRRYICKYDNGHDYGEIKFISTHRANSKANYEDAKTEMVLSLGNRAKNYDILETYRFEWEN